MRAVAVEPGFRWTSECLSPLQPSPCRSCTPEYYLKITSDALLEVISTSSSSWGTVSFSHTALMQCFTAEHSLAYKKKELIHSLRKILSMTWGMLAGSHFFMIKIQLKKRSIPGECWRTSRKGPRCTLSCQGPPRPGSGGPTVTTAS